MKAQLAVISRRPAEWNSGQDEENVKWREKLAAHFSTSYCKWTGDIRRRRDTTGCQVPLKILTHCEHGSSEGRIIHRWNFSIQTDERDQIVHLKFAQSEAWSLRLFLSHRASDEYAATQWKTLVKKRRFLVVGISAALLMFLLPSKVFNFPLSKLLIYKAFTNRFASNNKRHDFVVCDRKLFANKLQKG